MMTEICADLRNYFCQKKYFGEFKISGGELAPLDFLQDGQFFRIVGSTFNDGVHQYPSAGLTDEIFEGSVWAMSVPPALIALAAEIKDYVDKHEKNVSPYTAESYPNGYSYSKGTDASGAPISWKKVFAKRLNAWRKL